MKIPAKYYNQPGRHRRITAIVFVAIFAVIGSALLYKSFAVSGLLPPNNPGGNIAETPDIGQYCLGNTVDQGTTSTGLDPKNVDSCNSAAEAAADYARSAAEGLPALLTTPQQIANYGTLTVPEQEFALVNLERISRGLPYINGMTATLNADAQGGANSNTDPYISGPGNTDLTGGAPQAAAGGNWCGGASSVYSCDYQYMYFDGYTGTNAGNIACAAPGAAGCWGHRDNILMNFTGASTSQPYSYCGGDQTDSQIYMGAAVSNTYTAGSLSYAEVMVGSCGNPPPDIVYTWGDAYDTIYDSTAGVTGGLLSPTSNASVGCAFASTGGYWTVNSAGQVTTHDGSNYYGDTGSVTLNKPIVGMAATPDGKGYWLVASDGGIFNFGDAGFYGSTGSIALNAPIVGMASTPDGGGYWLVGSDGGVFNYGDAGFYGSTGSISLNKPIVSITSTPNGGGYWLAASDGGVFNFGDAGFYGSAGSLSLNKPVVGLASTPDGGGYWLVANDGGIFAYGDAPFYGSSVSPNSNFSVIGIDSVPGGYYLVQSDGTPLLYGHGSTAASNVTLPSPTISITSPTASQVLSHDVTISANPKAAPGQSIRSVGFSVLNQNGYTNLATVTQPPYNLTVNVDSPPFIVNNLQTHQPASLTDETIIVCVTDANYLDTCSTVVGNVQYNSGAYTPTQPTNLAVSALSPTSTKLSWTGSTLSGGTVSSYVIERSLGLSGFKQVGTTTGSTFTDTNLSPNTLYVYEVYAEGSNNTNSPNSNAQSVTTPVAPATPPTTPANLTVTATSANSANLIWSKSTAGSNPISGYYILRYSTGPSGSQVASYCSGSSCDYVYACKNYSTAYGGLDNISAIYLKPANQVVSDYFIADYRGSTQESRSDSDAFLYGIAGALTTSSSVLDNDHVSLGEYGAGGASTPYATNGSVNPSSINDCLPGISAAGNSSSFTNLGGIATNSWTDTSLSPGTTYIYEVEAYDSTGIVSSTSSPYGISTPSGTKTASSIPTKPTDLSVTAVSTSQINLSWNPSGVISPYSSVIGYAVYCNGSAVGLVLNNLSVPSIGIANLKPSTTYSCYVVAYNGSYQTSTASATVSVTTSALPVTVGIIYGQVTGSSGAGISGATVQTTVNGAKTTFTTTSSGGYLLANIPPGSYSVTFSASGYTSKVLSATATSGGVTLLNASLKAN